MEFQEAKPQTPAKDENDELLSRKISELSLAIQGTRLEALIDRLYAELDAVGITFKPKTYLADEWGCPSGIPVIGIPFYLADEKLFQLEGRLTDMDVEEEAEAMMILRHETGHAFNYAYKIYRKAKWRKIFGKYSLPYDDNYKPVPFSPKFVRHLPGWYAQKHPDEDFTETFAVWLTPGSNWRERYAGTPAMEKLLYVDELAREFGPKPPLVTVETPHMPVAEMTMTLREWYGPGKAADKVEVALPPSLDNELRTLFPKEEGEPAIDFVRAHRRHLIREVNFWTGINWEVLTALLDTLQARIGELKLKADPERNVPQAASLSIFIATLAMNYIYLGKFADE